MDDDLVTPSHNRHRVVMRRGQAKGEGGAMHRMPRPLATLVVAAALVTVAACSTQSGATASPTEMMESPTPSATEMMHESPSPADTMMHESPSASTP
jgi:hypothetical protein